MQGKAHAHKLPQLLLCHIRIGLTQNIQHLTNQVTHMTVFSQYGDELEDLRPIAAPPPTFSIPSRGPFSTRKLEEEAGVFPAVVDDLVAEGALCFAPWLRGWSDSASRELEALGAGRRLPKLDSLYLALLPEEPAVPRSARKSSCCMAKGRGAAG